MRAVQSAIAFCFGSHARRASPLTAFGAAHALHHVGEGGVPTRHLGERFRLCGSTVAAFTRQGEYVLPKVIGELDDG